MKGIILAGGSGTRLHPLTLAMSKQLMPVYDKPMIYYPLSVLMMAGINEILIISTPHDLPHFQKLLGDGANLGCRFEYCVQPSPDGLAQAFILGKDFIGDDSVALILGDNIFFGSKFQDTLKSSIDPNGGIVFAYHVSDPERYGVVEFDDNLNAISIEEKPLKPRSNLAIPGLYFFDELAVDLAKKIEPSERGELEITDLLLEYMKLGKLQTRVLPRGTVWLDAGTPLDLQRASNYVQIVEERQGMKIGCLEEISYLNGWMDDNQMQKILANIPECDYKEYLKRIRN
jgi:glucose-1-phosphate thymidylyltransferase